MFHIFYFFILRAINAFWSRSAVSFAPQIAWHAINYWLSTGPAQPTSTMNLLSVQLLLSMFSSINYYYFHPVVFVKRSDVCGEMFRLFTLKVHLIRKLLRHRCIIIYIRHNTLFSSPIFYA